MPRYKNDPFWLTARFGICKECKTNLKGKKSFFYPLTKDIFCESCGEKHSRDFESAKFDEDFYTASFGYNNLRG